MATEVDTMNVNRIGLIQGGADNTAIFKVVFAGEVLTAFDTAVKFKDKQRIRVLDNGKGCDFPAIDKATTHYHTPGTPLVGSTIASQLVTVTLDDKLVSDVFLADIDEAMAHYEVRGPYSNAMGNSLAVAYDKNVARNIILASRGAALFTGDQPGSKLVLAAYATDGSKLLDGIGSARQAMDEKNVPVDSDPIWAAVKPAQFYLVAATDRQLNKLYAGDGSAAKGQINTMYGVTLLKSNALPFGVTDVGNAAIPAKYQGDWTNTIGIVWHEAAVATAQLRDLSMEQEHSVRYQGDLMVGKYIVGHGVLRSKCAVELAIA